ncbi:amylo-alpha-1,6-glucosidase [Caldisalinibacter kiritimatiensis]|uniref:Putative glycogen debranching enzyme, archaeal type, TIGR01561 n=1 Tax=Caldisalinibacter kiritimatiensis TaxID=1304284 RepID=R1CQ32_9FIRM|nr:amylo-alpha-1,6-glucosidase [Caldisalinibacter kiritimatiensis]EOD00791.1 Putative glycogen debranching enzyme, archaeal type, TIGR01561 [Caldisalinibacter kiritimatiensis]
MEFGISDWNTFEKGIEKEYLITNGIGGFCSSTVIGANIRKYHGLLNASLVPPVKRYLLLSKIDEIIEVGNQKYNLQTNDFIGKRDNGHLYLRKFTNTLLPKFSYGIDDITIEKEIAMEYGKNTVVVVYKVETGNKPVKMTFIPYTNFRDHHDTSKREDFKYIQSYKEGILKLVEEKEKLTLKISSNCQYKEKEQWSLPMFYSNEKQRGLDCIDFHFIPGEFIYEMKPYSKYTIYFTATIEDTDKLDALSILEKEKERRQKLIEKAGFRDDMLKELVLAADQFIVNRESTGTKTVIAGYPWFTDWGRDTMIALPGLTLATKRYEDAKEILLTFVKYIKNGLIPNMFPDENVEPMYNTVDGTLWFFNAVYKYLEYTGDEETIKNEIYPYLKQIIKHHLEGTVYDIYVDEDGLLSAGGPGTQLTWMDVKVNGWVVTPRHGKAVEINALWYNALKIMELLSEKFGEDSKEYRELAEKTKKAFVDKFWNEKEKCLYDAIQDGKRIDKIRPNQIIAVSLPFTMLDKEKSRLVVSKVYEKLYTPYGLRTLPKDDREYIGQYRGDVLSRDGAYHQGTVWPWLIGPFIEAYVKVYDYSKESKNKAKEMLDLFKAHMKDGCIGSISEILEGDEPFYPRGCPAQAWSVAEVLRVYGEIYRS